MSDPEGAATEGAATVVGIPLVDQSLPEVAIRSQLFVIHGDLAKVHADGYLVPADRRLELGRRWLGVLLDSGRLPTWEVPVVARPERVKPGHDGNRLVVVTDIAADGTNFDHLVAGLDAALTEVEARWRHRRPPTLRERPLLAMPLIGAGRGGFRGVQGGLVRRVLHELDARVPELGFDIVLVCFDRAQYAAVQHSRRKWGLCTPTLPQELEVPTTRLAEHAAAGSLGVLFGAGVSMPLGLPNWADLLSKLAQGTAAERLGDLSTLDPMDAASLIMDELGRASVGQGGRAQDMFRARLAEYVRVPRHSLAHGLLASLRPAVAVTTNYDQGYELALEHVTGQPPPAVMPWDPPVGAAGLRVVKLHGDVVRGSVVLTRDQFVLMHALRRPLTALLQEQMLAHHVLAVGTSMSDATLVAAIAEASSLLRSVRSDRALGTLAMTVRDPARAALLQGAMNVLFADGPPWTAQRSGPPSPATLEPAAAARLIDVLLDRIALLAARETSYLADPQFRDLIVGEPRLVEVADRALALREAVDSAIREAPGTDLSAITRALDGLGANPNPSAGPGWSGVRPSRCQPVVDRGVRGDLGQPE